MACHRTGEVDLPAFLVAPRDEAFAEFRQHYPRCPECAAEVRAWTELHEALAAAHPEPEQLARYEALPTEERAVVDRHTEGCPSCREELAQLAGFDPARLAQPASAPEETDGGGLREWLAGLGRIVWSPAFAYALVGLLLLPVVQRLAAPDRAEPLAEQLFSEATTASPRDRAVRGLAPEVLEARPELDASLPRERTAAKRAAPVASKDEAVAGPPAAPKADAADSKEQAPAPPAQQRSAPSAPARAVAKSYPPASANLERKLEEATELRRASAARVHELTRAMDAEEGDAQEAFGAPLAPESEAGLADTSAVQDAPAPEPQMEYRDDLSRADAGKSVGFAPAVRSRLAGGAATAPAPAPRDLLRLEAWRTERVSPPPDIEALRVSVPVPEELPAGSAWLTVRDTERGRELRERVELPALGGERRVTLPVPRAWLAPGAYRVEIDADGRTASGLRFEVF